MNFSDSQKISLFKSENSVSFRFVSLSSEIDDSILDNTFHSGHSLNPHFGTKWNIDSLKIDFQPASAVVSSSSCFQFLQRRNINCGFGIIDEEDSTHKRNSASSSTRNWQNRIQLQKNAFVNFFSSLKKSLFLSSKLPRLNRGTIDSSKHLLAGALSAIVSRTALAPLERLKLEYMVCGATSSVNIVVNRILKKEGPFGFWRGNALNLLRTVPFKAINFCAFDLYRKNLIEVFGESNFTRLVAGAGAGVTATVICFPMDTIRTRMVAMGGEGFGNISSCFSEMIKAGGIVSVYRGIVPAIISMAPSGAVFYGTYDFLKTSYLKSPEFQAKLKALQAEEERLKSENREENGEEDGENTIFSARQLELGSLRTLLYGAVSGACAEIVTYPLEVVRRQMQLNPSRIGAFETFQHVMKNGGVKALYAGLLPSTLQVLPSAALSYFVYEFVKAQLNVQD